jgi:D-glycerate 3-kinase
MPDGLDHLRDAFDDVIREEGLPAGRLPQMIDLAAPVFELALNARSERGGALVVGICGPQGSGKTTLVRGLELALTRHGLSTAALSLDDLYLSRAARARLAETVHPLFATRGPPGTHDVELGDELLHRLAHAARGERTRLPRFDKSRDEPAPASRQPVFVGRADIILFEGWCVGARPQLPEELVEPVNALEAIEDAAGVWRGYANAQLGGRYGDMFRRLDRLVMLRAPAFEQVYVWRKQQEDHLARRLAAAGPSSGPSAIMDETALRRFIMHFERVSRHIHRQMPAYADLVLQLDADRHLTAQRPD